MRIFIGRYYKVIYRWGDFLATTIRVIIDGVFFIGCYYKVIYRLDHMTFTRSRTIQGNGGDWWELPCKPHLYALFILCIPWKMMATKCY